MILGYARVSTEDQNLDGQRDALEAAGAGRVFADKISGSLRARPELDRMLDQLRAGDVVVVTKYDRLARSLKDLLEIVETGRGGGGGVSQPRRGHRHHDAGGAAGLPRLRLDRPVRAGAYRRAHPRGAGGGDEARAGSAAGPRR